MSRCLISKLGKLSALFFFGPESNLGNPVRSDIYPATANLHGCLVLTILLAMTKTDIRPLEKTELNRFQFFPFGTMETHRRGFELQRVGKLVFLVAWLADQPVGQVLLNWIGGDGSGVPPQIRELPEVSSLFVTQSCRRMGVATQLLDVAEHMTYAHAYDQIGLCVAQTNLGAQSLYALRGYSDCGWPPYLARGTFVNKSGHRREWEETRLYWVKTLGEAPSKTEADDKKK
jgi:GNAT superfamily N-acetyltransferase